MSIQTDLSVSPYFDDYNENSDFYKILFRPGVSVQARELNQLQTLLQKQIERFGDNIFKTGTIVSGCDIAFHDDLKYVKLKDIQNDSTPVVVSNYKGYRVKGQDNIVPLTAAIISYDSGFESRRPNLNTLYLRYLNSGQDSVSGSRTTFQASDILTVFNPLNVIEKIAINNPSANFNDSDKVVILSAIGIQNANSGKTFTTTFSAGDYITNGTANVKILATDANTLNNSLVLKIAPKPESLKVGDPSAWTFNEGDTIQKIGSTGEVITVSDIIGTGATATLTTSNLGGANTINMVTKGSGYIVLPSVSISSTAASLSDISLFSATAQNYLAQVTIDSTDNPTGNTYGMTVSSGVVYQKGYFSHVSEQLLIVEKYNNVPDQKSVGFQTVESIVTSNQDETLLDNATGSPNYTAPGANRLKLSPTLVVMDKATADGMEDFLYIAEFSNGAPYKQNRQTVYNIIGDNIAQRSFEQAGNYVLDPFLVNTKSPDTFANEATKFNVVIDPGTAYINGKRVQTVYNYEQAVDKGIDTVVGSGTTISMNYGNYVYVNEFAGSFDFGNSAVVNLYDQSAKYLTNERASFSPVGNSIGTARIRSVVYDSGVPGSPSAVYRMYLFDIRMNSGYNFKNTKSIYYSNSRRAICDIVLQNGIAVLNDNTDSTMIFNAGQAAIKNITGITYLYRTSSTQTLLAAGTMTINAPSGETFPYSGTLSTTNERDVIVVPLTAVDGASSLTGTVTTTNTSNVVVGSSTSFVTDLLSGDYIKFADGTVKQIASISNNTLLTLTANAGVSLAANTYKMHFPANVAISFARSTRTMVCNAPYNQLSINLGMTIAGDTSAIVTQNIKTTAATGSAKTINRNKYVRLCLANNVSSNSGPWALGVSDVFRLNKVFKGSNGTFTANASTTVIDITNDFYIDHNQNEDYYGISYLYKKPNTSTTLSTGDWLLVSLDYFAATAGLKTLGSYTVDDTLTLENSPTSINTLEIPEVYGTSGTYYDLRDQIDLRPQTNNAVTPSANSVLAPLNPIDPPFVIKTDLDNKYPVPDSVMTANVEYYLPRSDRVIVDDTNQFRVIKGTPGTDIAPTAPENSLTLNILKIPPYPSLPYSISSAITKFADTRIANEKFTTRRLRQYRVTTALTDNDISTLQPRNYTMEEISKLERRVSDLEYYTSLSLVETLTQKKTIPSSTDPNVDRYKFGFYVDGFEDYSHSDVSNPGYRAAIVDGYLSPAVEELNLKTNPTSGDVGLPFAETTFISQSRATDGPVSATGSATGVVSQNIVCVSQANRNSSTDGSAPFNSYDEFFYVFSSSSGNIEFYMVAPWNAISTEIYQSVSPFGPWSLVTSSQYAEAITNQDIAKKQLSSVLHPGSLNRLGTGPDGGFVTDQFKFTASHDPSKGIYYKVRVYKGGLTSPYSTPGSFKYLMCYPTDALVNTINTNITTNYPMSFGGLFNRLGAGRPFEGNNVRNV